MHGKYWQLRNIVNKGNLTHAPSDSLAMKMSVQALNTGIVNYKT